MQTKIDCLQIDLCFELQKCLGFFFRMICSVDYNEMFFFFFNEFIQSTDCSIKQSNWFRWSRVLACVTNDNVLSWMIDLISIILNRYDADRCWLCMDMAEFVAFAPLAGPAAVELG